MITFNWYTFSLLTTRQLYALLALRSEVFVVEQNCAYHDLDGKDFNALHLFGTENEKLCAYLRLFSPSKNNSDVVLGRVVTAPSTRKKGYGKKLINQTLHYCEQNFTNVDISCSAQLYLKNFYESFGFKAIGDVYSEDCIPHILMKKENKKFF